MAQIYTGVIDTATGDLLRCGYSDFENDGSFDGANETIKTDLPNPGTIKDNENGKDFDRWDGAAWVKVTP